MLLYQIDKISHGFCQHRILAVYDTQSSPGIFPVQAEESPALSGESYIILDQGTAQTGLNQIEQGRLVGQEDGGSGVKIIGGIDGIFPGLVAV